jgi:hypothetical protein
MNDPEYQLEASILNKKIKCDRIREILGPKKDIPSRGEILLNLVKSSWLHEHTKNKRYNV